MSILAIAQLYVNKELNADQIIDIYNESIKDNDIMNNLEKQNILENFLFWEIV
jgi:hypothetical protein